MASVMGLRKILLAKLLVVVRVGFAVWAVVRIRFVVGLWVVVSLFMEVMEVLEVMEVMEVMEGDVVIIACFSSFREEKVATL